MSDMLLALFKKWGDIVQADGHHSVDLNAPDQAWIVSSGKVDLFYQGPAENGHKSQLHHLMRMEPGEVFFGVDASIIGTDYKFTAKGLTGTKLIQLETKTLINGLRSLPGEPVSKIITPWFSKVSRSMVREPQPTDHITFSENNEKEIEEKQAVLPLHGMLWFQCEGGASFLGHDEWPEIDGKYWTPVSGFTWLVTSKPGLVKAISTLEFLERDDCWEHIAKFHALALNTIPRGYQNLQKREQERLQQIRDDEASTLKDAVINLASSAMQSNVSTATVGDGDELYLACKMVGKASHIEIKKPTVSMRFDNRDPLGSIMRVSRIRNREVVLSKDWWREDNGPLLGFLEEGEVPVAILPIKPNKYQYFDPQTRKYWTITKDIAKRFHNKAQKFYRPFPEEPLRFRDLLRYMFNDIKTDLNVIALTGLAGGLLGLILPLLTGLIFDSAIPEANYQQLYYIAVGLVISAFSTAMFNFTRNIAMLRTEGKVDGNLQAAIWDRLLTLPTSFFKSYTAGDLNNRAMGISSVRSILSESIVTTIISSIFSVFNLFLLFYYSTKLGFVALILVTIAVIPSGLSFIQIRYERTLASLEGKITGSVFEFIRGIAKLRVSAKEAKAFRLWAKLFGAKKKLTFKIRLISNVVNVWTEMFTIFSLLTVFGFMSLVLANEEQITIGSFLAFNAAYGQLLAAVLALMSSFVSSLSLIPLMERLDPILKEKPEIDLTKAHPGTLNGSIEVRHLSFRYNPEGPMVLDDVSFSVAPGEFVAVVGASGSGKSTLLRHLLGFEKPHSGSIYYDGKDLAGIDIQVVRRQLGVVLQHSKVLSHDVFRNIIGSLPLTMKDAWKAAEMAGLKADIEAMPMKMHTLISEGGSTISGGQRQRILIARALVTTPRYLFLDEATSALDNETQAVVSQSLESLHVTRIVIAHRLSTIMNADKIIVMDKGKVVEVGDYKELMKLNGVFSKLASRQIA